jgi:hypothetical protein
VLATLTMIAAGCGGQVIAPSQSSDATSGSGGASATATATASGAGGMSGVGGSSVASTSTGGAPACNDPTVFVDILGDGPNQHVDASCAPEAHLTLPGGAKTPPPKQPPPPASGTLTVTACPLSPNLVLLLNGQSTSWPASIANATIIYFHDGAEYDESPTESGALEVLTFEPVGGVIEGTFSATMTPKDPAGIPSKIQITGKFRVCRGPDWVPV